MKKILDKILNKLNYFHKNNFKNKEYKSFFEGILFSHLANNKNLAIVQVGANDGVKGDPLYNFILKFNDKIKLLAIEPQFEVFKRLKENYSKINNVFFSQNAIGDGSEKEFYSFNSNYSKFHSTENTFDRHSSFEKEHLLKYLRNHSIKEKDFDYYINTNKIKSVTLGEAIQQSKANFSEIDVLQIDTEGHDDLVIYNSSIDKYKYKFINYEFKQLSVERLNKLHLFLKKNNYEIIRWKKSDELAYIIK